MKTIIEKINNFKTKQIRKQNESVAMQIHKKASSEHNGLMNAVFIFIPDKSVRGKRLINYVCYWSKSVFGLEDESNELLSKTWNDVGIDCDTFKGEVYSFGPFSIFPIKLYSTNI